ncbi:MAG TPA: GNAT family N-acetyltransferase, partial [Chitinophagaceae bacterium]|nr:GNAT family N-acetyltransferase [Chitinophagaceae bacterium]
HQLHLLNKYISNYNYGVLPVISKRSAKKNIPAMLIIRKARETDREKLYALYKAVAEKPFGIARNPQEVTEDYINHFMQEAAATGVEIVIEHPTDPGQLIADIHCHKMAPAIFSHVLSDLTIAVHPDFQGKGLGKNLFTGMLDYITHYRTDIRRVELFTQESNLRALALYKSIGFVAEGRFEQRVPGANNTLEADIPMAWFNPAYIAPSKK